MKSWCVKGNFLIFFTVTITEVKVLCNVFYTTVNFYYDFTMNILDVELWCSLDILV